jgi:hypothetical protein
MWLKHQGRLHMRDFPLLELGTLRLVTSVALHEKAYSVEASVLTLPCWNRGVTSGCVADSDEPPLALEEGALSTDHTTPVYTFELRKMHEELFLHDSLKDMIDTLEKEQERQGSAGSMVDVGSPVAGEKRVSEVLLRSLLGLSVMGEVVTSEWISTLLGKPRSQERAELCDWLQTRMSLSLTYTQRGFFLDWEHSLAALHCVYVRLKLMRVCSQSQSSARSCDLGFPSSVLIHSLVTTSPITERPSKERSSTSDTLFSPATGLPTSTIEPALPCLSCSFSKVSIMSLRLSWRKSSSCIFRSSNVYTGVVWSVLSAPSSNARGGSSESATHPLVTPRFQHGNVSTLASTEYAFSCSATDVTNRSVPSSSNGKSRM